MAATGTSYMPSLPIDHVFPGLRGRIPATRFARCEAVIERFFSRTLLRTDDGSPFVITGDIPAMWLRDSTWQVEPLLRSPLPEIGRLLAEVSRTQVRLVLLDPYANAFNPGPTGNCWHKDLPDQSDWVFERKYELDSLACVLRLARRTMESFGVTDHLDAQFHAAVDVIIALARREQYHDPGSYVFRRDNGVAHDSLSHDGHGAPTQPTGMVWSAFRPSDDACVYGFHVASNLFFAHELRRLGRADATLLAEDIEAGVARHAITNHGYAYEVDGLGNALFIDDANVPSLLSLPYLGVCATDDPLYLTTRRRLLSADNPWWFSGEALSGIGSQHTPGDHVWPIAVAIQAMTSTNPADLGSAMELLEATDAGTGFMHESVHVDDPGRFTREWFSWADMTWLDLVLRS